MWSIGLILYYLYFNTLPFNNLKDFFDPNKKVILKETKFKLLDDLLSKLIIKDPTKRINWDNYFIHHFNTQQIIEINVNIEDDHTNTRIVDNQYFIYVN